MLITNECSFPTSRITKLVDWVTKKYKYPYVARLHLIDGPGKTMGAGNAYRWDPTDNVDPLAPSLIVLQVSRNRSYPVKDTYCDEKDKPYAEEVTIHSWDEEFVLILAHELRHIDQFFCINGNGLSERQMEEDAEKFAIKVLSSYRKTRRKPLTKKGGKR